ncbi:15-hydroxyprostaglandin dehydrogenase [NAD(+)] [Blattella germanica]|nr:15-hydroxyprostaglandin dehydrogenase [NAD(+)] [Blattella germanica]
MDPKGKTALVTGAVQGIGLAITKELLRQGVKGVSVCDVNAMKGMIVIQELQEEFGKERVIFIKTDVTNEKEVEGICDESNWKRTVNVNMNGVIQGNLMALKYMGKTRGGSGGVVVNVASVGGLVSIAAVAIYSATKSGIIALSRSLGVNATDTEILSGLTNNELIPVDIGTVMSSNHSEIQKTESVSKGILHIIREGNPGSIWISAKDKPVYEIKIPYYEDLKV